MDKTPAPESRFKRYERVSVSRNHDGGPIAGTGTIVWLNAPQFRGRFGWTQWLYVVELDEPAPRRWVTFLESELASLGETSSPRNHLGTRNEVSFDVEGGREGCLRRPGRFWEAFFIQESGVSREICKTSTWDSGIIGHLFEVPRGTAITDSVVLDVIGNLLGMSPIVVVHGPDSLVLK